jgi:hypothetical protein
MKRTTEEEDKLVEETLNLMKHIPFHSNSNEWYEKIESKLELEMLKRKNPNRSFYLSIALIGIINIGTLTYHFSQKTDINSDFTYSQLASDYNFSISETLFE